MLHDNTFFSPKNQLFHLFKVYCNNRVLTMFNYYCYNTSFTILNHIRSVFIFLDCYNRNKHKSFPKINWLIFQKIKCKRKKDSTRHLSIRKTGTFFVFFCNLLLNLPFYCVKFFHLMKTTHTIRMETTFDANYWIPSCCVYFVNFLCDLRQKSRS